jgi:hypothetical protein
MGVTAPTLAPGTLTVWIDSESELAVNFADTPSALLSLNILDPVSPSIKHAGDLPRALTGEQLTRNLRSGGLRYFGSGDQQKTFRTGSSRSIANLKSLPA